MLETVDDSSGMASETPMTSDDEICKFHKAACSGDAGTVLTILTKYLEETSDQSEGDGKHCLLEHRDETDNGRTALLQASRFGHLDVVKIMVEKGADVLVQDIYSSDDTVIHLAAEFGHLPIVEYLLEIQPELIDVRNKDADSPLWKAAFGGHRDIVEFLITKKGANIESRGRDGMTPLIIASYQGNHEVVDLLKNSRADVFAKDNSEMASMAIHVACDRGHLNVVGNLLAGKAGLVEAKDKFGNMPLCRAASNGRVEVIQFLVDKMQYSVEARGYMERTPLMQAAMKSQVNAVRYFAKERKANLYAMDATGSMAIHLAADQGDHDVISTLLELDPNLLEAKDTSGKTAAWRAAWAGQMNLLDFLIEQKRADLESRNNEGWTLLISAAREGRLQIVQILVKKFANLRARDLSDNASMAIHLASFYGHVGVVACLLDVLPELIEAREAGGETPLFRAAFRGQTEVVRFLVSQKHASVNAVNELGRSALMAASREGHLEVVKFLLENGADLSLKDLKETTAIHLAAYNGHIKIVDLLVTAKPEVLEVKDNNGRTPLACAVMNDKDDVVNLLEQKGAVKKSWLAALFGF